MNVYDACAVCGEWGLNEKEITRYHSGDGQLVAVVMVYCGNDSCGHAVKSEREVID